VPYISESRNSELAHLHHAVDEVVPHVPAWIKLVERYVASLPPDGSEGSGQADRSHAEHELAAMKRDLGTLSRALDNLISRN
jgi:hypothetical protein